MFLRQRKVPFSMHGVLNTELLFPHHSQQKSEDIKGTIRSRKSEKDRQHNCQTKTDKGTNNDQQNTTQKTKDWETPTPLNTGDELMCSERVAVSSPLMPPVVILFLQNPVISH
jgi:hypothetical protein